jgi:thiamine biosynthesis lipoprotein
MSSATLPRRAWVEQIMGLPVSVHVRGGDPADPRVERRVAEVFAELRRADAVFSTYREDSELSRWERGELGLEAADPDLAEVIELCAEATRRTGGWFDPHGLPDPRTGLPRYDPSGLVKGWAVERAAGRLADLHGYGWCVNAGGDVLVATPDGQPPWRIGVEDPADKGRVLRVLECRTGAVATSGSAHRGGHIIDPHTGRAATGVRAVTVVGPQLLWADVYATAAAAAGPWSMPWLDGLEGYAALLVTASGLQRVTEDWPAG